MSTFSDLLSKAQQLDVELAKEGTVLVGEAATVLSDLIENLQHEVSKEVGAAPASTPTGEPTPNADGAEAAKAAEAPEAPAEPETPAEDAGEQTEEPAAPADPAAGVQTSSDING